MNDFPDNALELINRRMVGFNKAMGLRFIKADAAQMITELEVQDKHHQAYGIVHGGVYAAMIETTCSSGAALTVLSEGKSTVGLENSTSFLRAVRSGVLRCVATPCLIGKRSHVWEARIYDDRKRLAATGRVRLIVLEPGSRADGKAVGVVEEQ